MMRVRVRPGFSLVELVTAVIISSALVVVIGLLIVNANQSLMRSQAAMEQRSDMTVLTRHMENRIRQADTAPIRTSGTPPDQLLFDVNGATAGYRYVAAPPGVVQFSTNVLAAPAVWYPVIRDVTAADFALTGTGRKNLVTVSITQTKLRSFGKSNEVLVSSITLGTNVR